MIRRKIAESRAKRGAELRLSGPVDWLAWFISTAGGAGMIPFGPGTWGSLVGLLLVYGLVRRMPADPLALQNALEREGMVTRLMSAIRVDVIAEPFIRRRAVRHFEKGRIVIFAAGTGNPYFTTDTAAALRAAEMGCDALMKGTQVEGVYTADPKLDPAATRFDTLPYSEVLARDLKVMDAAAISLMRDNAIPIVVFNIHQRGGLGEVLSGRGVCTIIRD